MHKNRAISSGKCAQTILAQTKASSDEFKLLNIESDHFELADISEKFGIRNVPPSAKCLNTTYNNAMSCKSVLFVIC